MILKSLLLYIPNIPIRVLNILAFAFILRAKCHYQKHPTGPTQQKVGNHCIRFLNAVVSRLEKSYDICDFYPFLIFYKDTK